MIFRIFVVLADNLLSEVLNHGVSQPSPQIVCRNKRVGEDCLQNQVGRERKEAVERGVGSGEARGA